MKKLLSLILLFPIMLSAQVVEKFPVSSSNPTGYVVARPSDAATDGLPCIIHLHGVGGQGDGTDANLQRLVNGELPQELQKAAQKYKIVVIAPQVGGWNYNTAIAYCRNVAINTYKVNPDAISLWGLSAGGSGVTGYTSASVTNASQFATAVVVCGAGSVSSSGAKNITDAKLPIIFFHASNDGTVSVSNTNNSVTELLKYSAPVPAKKVIYSGGDHWIWGKVYNPDVWPWVGNESQGLYEWALSNRRGQPKAVPEIAPSTEMIVNAGEDIVTTTGKVKLDGSKTTNWKSACWKAVAVPTGVSIWGVGACCWINCESVTVPSPGEYKFELKCYDANGAFKTDTVKVTYSTTGTPTPPEPPAPTKTIVARLFVAGMEIIVYSDKTAEVK